MKKLLPSISGSSLFTYKKVIEENPYDCYYPLYRALLFLQMVEEAIRFPNDVITLYIGLFSFYPRLAEALMLAFQNNGLRGKILVSYSIKHYNISSPFFNTKFCPILCDI